MDAQLIVQVSMQDGFVMLFQEIELHVPQSVIQLELQQTLTGTAGYFIVGPYECNAGPYTVGTQVGCTDGCMLEPGQACVKAGNYPTAPETCADTCGNGVIDAGE